MMAIARGRAGRLGVLGFVVAMTGGRLAVAQVTQTDAAKTPLPQPVGAAESTLVNNSWAWNANTLVNRDPAGVILNPAVKYGDFYAPPSYPQFVTGDAITLNGLFKWRREAIDPVADAKTGPGYFSAKCGFSGELLLMGGNCQATFGWYNVLDPTSKTPPAAAEIYPFIDAPRSALKCVDSDGITPNSSGFCPLAWDNRGPYDLSIVRWVPKSFSSGDISQDPRYKGGYVAFALIGDPARCPQNKYSMYEHNVRNTSGEPWVTSLIYQSKLDPSGVYMAFEDLPMSPADWKKGNDNYPGADGDFNDFVVYVSGVSCAGGNQPCDTGQFGACAVGRTDCALADKPSVCRPAQPASAEVCDNIDNDCDGVVDSGAGLCPDADKPVCFQGACVGSCKDGAFPCPSGFSCDATGQCVDPACAVLSCKPGTTCRNGVCLDKPCAGVVCPNGTQCELGRCVDPCAGVTCSGGRVCDQGRCIAPCTCAGCDAGLSCGSDGHCIDAACAGKSCASGQICRLGACVDPCANVVCPGNGLCSGGTCVLPMSGAAGSSGALSFAGNSSAGTGSAGTTESGEETAGIAGSSEAGDDSAGAATAAGGTSAGAGATAASGVVTTAGAGPEKSSSCAYAVLAPEQSPRRLAWLGLVFGLTFMRRRRRSRARQ